MKQRGKYSFHFFLLKKQLSWQKDYEEQAEDSIPVCGDDDVCDDGVLSDGDDQSDDGDDDVLS